MSTISKFAGRIGGLRETASAAKRGCRRLCALGAVLLGVVGSAAETPPAELSVDSPNGRLSVCISTRGPLTCRLLVDGVPALRESRLGLRLRDGELGLAGVKIDFMDRDDQEMVQWYEKIARAAAKHHLMVNFHGAYKPTGLLRTLPNQITCEGILGNEYNKWSTRVNAEHRTTLPFTRFLAGPGDFTPGGFLNRSTATVPRLHTTVRLGHITSPANITGGTPVPRSRTA